MRAPILFIYEESLDGFTAAWVFDKFRRKGLSIIDQPVAYHQASVGTAPPDCKGKEVWLIDFTYPREILIEKVIKPSRKTIIFEHHKESWANLDGLTADIRRRGLQRDDKIIYDVYRSGAGILYDELAREYGKRAGQHIPSQYGERSFWLVDYIEDYTLGKNRMPISKDIAKFCAAGPMTFSEWDQIDIRGALKIAEAGHSMVDPEGDSSEVVHLGEDSE